MPFWKKNEEPQGDDLDLGAIFDSDDAFVPYVAPEKVPLVIDKVVLDALSSVRDCESIRGEKVPSWTRFFKNLKVLEEYWFDLLDAGEVSCPCFPDEFFDEEELTTVEWIFSEPKFLNGMVQFIDGEVHFACWLLTSEHRSHLSPAFLTKLFTAIIDSEMGDGCEECAQNGWWGSPLTYLAENPNSPSPLLKKIFIEASESDNEAALATLAQSVRTPNAILLELAEMDKTVLLLDDEMCPLRDKAGEQGFNIGQMARATLAALKS